MFKNGNNKVINLALMSAGLAMSVQALAGSASSGGGSVVSISPNAAPVLLDFYLENPAFTDVASLTGDQIQVSSFANTLGYDRIDMKTVPSYALVQARLKAWEQNSPVVTGLIQTALIGMEWTYTPFRQDLCGEAKVTNDALNVGHSLESAVVFRKNFGARISSPIWNRLGEYSHAGLVVHEALRHVQFVIGEDLNYSTLMSITAKIMLSDPSGQPAGFTLDNANWFSGELKREIENLADFEKFSGETCEAIQCTARSIPVLSLSGMKDFDACNDFRARAPFAKGLDEVLKTTDTVVASSQAMVDAAHSALDAEQITLEQYRKVVQIHAGVVGLAASVREGLGIQLAYQIHGAANTFVVASEEATLRRYLNGDSSGFDRTEKAKMNKAISSAQSQLHQMLQDNYTLRCE